MSVPFSLFESPLRNNQNCMEGTLPVEGIEIKQTEAAKRSSRNRMLLCNLSNFAYAMSRILLHMDSRSGNFRGCCHLTTAGAARRCRPSFSTANIGTNVLPTSISYVLTTNDLK